MSFSQAFQRSWLLPGIFTFASSATGWVSLENVIWCKGKLELTICFSTEKDSGSYSHLQIAVHSLLLELAGSQGLRCLSCGYLKGATGLRERKAASQVWGLLSESSPTSAHSSAKKELTLKIQPCRWLYYCCGFIYVCIFISPTLLTFLFFLL